MLTDDLLEDRLRRHFAESLVSQEDLVARVLQRHRRRRARRVTALALPAVLAAATLGSVLGAVFATTGTPPRGAPVVLRLASYRFSLPEGFRRSSTSAAACRAFVTTGLPQGTAGSAPPVATLSPYTTATIATATAATGGCVTMLLTSPFVATATTPVPYLRSHGAVTNAPVQVGPYRAWLTTQAALTEWLQGQGLVSADAPLPDLQLSVEVPQGGEERLLEVGSQGVSDATLLGIVGQGLSS